MKLTNKIFTVIAYAIILYPISYVNADDQLFGGKDKDKESSSSKKASKQMVLDEAPIMEMPKILPPISRNKIESVIPVRRLPDGWVFRDELLAPWSTSLPAV